MISFEASKEDADLIDKIVARIEADYDIDRTEFMMDLLATHNSCPLKLKELLETDRFNFYHDIGGIRQHLNRRTGHLENCFLPRFAIIKE